MARGVWAPEVVALLTQFWTERGMTVTAIARALGEHLGQTVNRNAVVGKIARLGLIRTAGRKADDEVTARHRPDVGGQAAPSAPVRYQPVRKDEVAPKAASRPSIPTSAEVFAEPKAPAVDREPGTYRIDELRQGECRFACTLHDAPREDHRFCGAPTTIGPGNLHGSWCPAHLRIVWAAAGRNAGGPSVADAAEGRHGAPDGRRSHPSARRGTWA